MSDETNNKGGVELDLGDDLNWDDALKEWEAELERDPNLREADAADVAPPPPLPQAAPPRPLYRPPTEEDLLADTGRPSTPGAESLFDDEEEIPTRASDPPTQDDLTARDAPSTTENTKPTAPPPGGIELDLDSLLGELDDVTTGSDIGSDSLSDPFGGLIPMDDEPPTRAGPAPDLAALMEPPAPAAPAAPAPKPAPPPAEPSPWSAKAQRTRPGVGLPVPPPADAPPARGPIYKPPPPPPGPVAKPRPPRPLEGLKRPIKPEAAEAADESTPRPHAAKLDDLSPLDRPTPVVDLPSGAKPKPPPLPPKPPPLDRARAKADEAKPATKAPAELPKVTDAEPVLDEPTSDEPDLTFDADGESLDMIIGDEHDHAIIDDDYDDGLDEMTQLGVAPDLAEVSRKPSSIVPEADAGAATAARTVQYRKPRPESFPLVGPDALRARRELLVSLATNTKGSTRARLLVATAEICDQLGESNQASELYREAHDADPSDLTALRARRRAAIAVEAWGEAAELLEAESKLQLSPEERAAALTLLAEVQLTALDKPDEAMKSARTALGLRRSSPAAAILLADAAFRAGRDAEGLAALERAVEAWPDTRARCALLTMIGHGSERMGRADKARDAYAGAIEADPSAVDVVLGLARAERASNNLDAAVVAVARLGERSKDEPIGDALRRAAARAVHLGAKRPADGSALLFDARSVPALRARATAALDAEDADARVQFVEAWAAAAGGTERALALVSLAELRAEAGDLDAADAALRDAAIADSTLAFVRVIRELLARKAKDTARLARALGGGAAGGTAIVAAAKLARVPGASEDEASLLREAQNEEEGSVAADVIALDVAAATGDEDGVLTGLRRQIERSTGEQRVGALVALAREAMRRGNDVVAETMLKEAREVLPTDATVLRALAGALESRAATEAANAWLEEASLGAPGDRAAFAATFAGRLLELGRAPSMPAYERALQLSPGHGPAAWALEPSARAMGDGKLLAEIDRGLADRAEDPVEAAGRHIRAALLEAAESPETAAQHLEKARDACPTDAILLELVLRLGGSADAVARADMLEESAVGAPPDVRRAALLRAAAAQLEAGHATKAAALYRGVLEERGADPIAERGLDLAEVAAQEVSRAASRRFDAVKSAPSDEVRVQALQQLADLDLHDRNDPSSAVLSLQSILEIAPGHLPSLRTLERYFMDHGRHEDLANVEHALVKHLPDAQDVVPHARLHARLVLAPAEASGDAADSVLLDALDRGTPDLWLARRALAAARERADGEREAKAALAVAARVGGTMEHAEAALRAAEALRDLGRADESLGMLARAVAAAPQHGAAARTLGEIRESEGDDAAAAEAYEIAARAATVPSGKAAMFHRAGVLAQEKLDDDERALRVFTLASEADVTYMDVFTRTKGLLEARGDRRGLAELTERRIAAGGDVPVLAEMHAQLAILREALADQRGAKEALRSALALEGDNAEALHKLAELSLADQDYRAAAEALIRIARLRKDREELQWVFSTLGDIYDKHMPDPRRAEAAFKRVLKLVPTDVDAMERLARLYESENDVAQAAEMYELLAKNELDPDKNRDHRLRLASALERRGDLRNAEAVLEQTRRNSPVDLVVLRSMAELYQRQNAPQALSMHLNRAVSDFRHAIQTDATDAAAWPGLVEVLRWRGRMDAARVCAAAAFTLAIRSEETQALIDAFGGVPGAGARAADPELDDVIGSQTIPRAARTIFELATDAFEKALPFDPRAVRAERASGQSSAAFVGPARDVAHWFGVGEAQIWITSHAPRVCVPLALNPFTVLIGQELVGACDERERRFLLARAARIAKAHLAVAARSQPRDVAVAIAGLVRAYDSTYAPAGLDPAHVAEMAKRIGKALPKKTKDELAAHVIEMSGTQGFDPARLGLLACELGDRAALLATGSLPSAVSALLRLAGIDGLDAMATRARFEAIRRIPEAQDLFLFAIGDAHFEARKRTGADRV